MRLLLHVRNTRIVFCLNCSMQVPTLVMANDASSVSVGNGYTCVVTTSAVTKCWGYGKFANDYRSFPDVTVLCGSNEGC